MNKKSSYKDQIAKVLSDITGTKNPQVEFSSNEQFGDYSSNVAMVNSKQEGNFLENIEWIVKKIKKNNWEKSFNNHEGLPVGRLTPEVQKAVGSKSDLVFLKPRVYAKMKGWWKTFSGHTDLDIEFWLLPLTISFPLGVYEERDNKFRFFLTFNYKHLGKLIVEIDEFQNQNQIVTMFLVNEGRLKKKISLLGKRRISSLLASHLSETAGAGLSGLQESQLFYNRLETESQGKFSLNYEIKRNPVELAAEISDKFNQRAMKLGFTAENVGGFINFKLRNDILIGNLIQIDSQKEDYGKSDLLKSKKIVLEFTDPNPFKEFHIGHVYTNTVGESLSRILEANGATVHRVNYQGDVGLHVAKAIWGLREYKGLDKKTLKERVEIMGKAYALGSRAYEEDSTTKEEINALNKKIFEGNSEYEELYKKGRAWSLEYFETIYKRLGTKFNNYYFESKVGKVGEKIVRDNLKSGVFEKSKGAIIFNGKKYGLHDRVFINSLGLPTYEAKELGLAPTKYKDFPYDLSIIITGNEITEYFKVLIKAMSLIYPDLGDKTMHIGHGMVKLPEGKMSSRTGKIVTGEWLLDEVKQKASKLNKNSAEMVAIAAVKYAFLKVGIGKDIVYDIGESLSLEGNSGPYIQYTVARANSVLRKAEFPISNFQFPMNFQLSNEEQSVLRKLAQLQEVIVTAAKSYSPNVLCNYLYDLASKFNTFYNKYRILDSEEEKLILRLRLTSATAQVLKNGLKLLGIGSPEKM